MRNIFCISVCNRDESFWHVNIIFAITCLNSPLLLEVWRFSLKVFSTLNYSKVSGAFAVMFPSTTRRHQHGTIEDLRGSFDGAGASMPCSSSPTQPHATQTSYLLPPLHFSLCIEPGQDTLPQLWGEFFSGAPDILLFPQAWVGIPYLVPTGIPTTTFRAAFEISGPFPSKRPWTFFCTWANFQPPAGSASQGCCEESSSVSP